MAQFIGRRVGYCLLSLLLLSLTIFFFVRVTGDLDQPLRRSRVGQRQCVLHSGVTYAPEMPPSTRNVDAVTNDASSLARKSAA